MEIEKNLNDLLDTYDPLTWTPALQTKYEKNEERNGILV